MIIPDANLLIYAYRADSPHHEKALVWWESLIDSRQPVGIPIAIVLTFIRLCTNGYVIKAPTPLNEVLEAVNSWFDEPNVQLLFPGDRHIATLSKLLTTAGFAGNLTNDAHLAALALEYRATVASNDTDFARFPGVKSSNPLR